MTAATFIRPQSARPRSFTPPGNRIRRLSHLDPRPLWPDPVAAQSPWKSIGFWAACALVLPVAVVVAPVRAVRAAF